MIFVTDKGRMANNILQYAHLYAWGRENGRTTMSMRFAYKYHNFHICHTRYHNPLMYLLGKVAAKLHLIPTANFDSLDSDYRSELHTIRSHRHVMATGWCVRFPELFLKYKDEILKLFAFDPVVTTSVDRLLDPCADQLKLGVHIRRGDYATWCNGHYFFDDNQYLHVIREFIRMSGKRKVAIFICGNDPKLDHAFYKEALGESNVHFPQGTPPEDLCLLSRCDAIIGPPSTFSLVASMYQDAPLHWITNADATLSQADFGKFDTLFQTFDSYYIE